MESETLTDEIWQAIITNDISYDCQFFYAVKTTGIFCRPSCKSRPPNKENISLFPTVEMALLAKYRPCKRCKPTGQRLPDVEWVSLATEYMDRHFTSKLSLEILAENCHGSPFHLHRTFKKVKGITPVDYIQQKRMDMAKELLFSSDKSIAEIGVIVGLSNTPYFITLFKKKTGFTPVSYRKMLSQNKKEAFENGK